MVDPTVIGALCTIPDHGFVSAGLHEFLLAGPGANLRDLTFSAWVLSTPSDAAAAYSNFQSCVNQFKPPGLSDVAVSTGAKALFLDIPDAVFFGVIHQVLVYQDRNVLGAVQYSSNSHSDNPPQTEFIRYWQTMIRHQDGPAPGFTSPDVKVIRYIRDFNEQPAVSGEQCANELANELSTSVEQALAACLLLEESHNPDPPDTFTDQSWQTYKDSNEYRGYVHVPPVNVTCDGSKITTVNGANAVDVSTNPSGAEQQLAGFEESPGYTPQRPMGDGYDAADVPDSDNSLGIVNGDTVRMRLFNQQNLLVSYVLASRISEVGRVGAGALLGLDAPYIWTVIQERITCRSANVAVVETEFPTGRYYINDKFATETFQSHLGDFIRSGGTTFHQPGAGSYALACRGLTQYTTRGTPALPLQVPKLGTDVGCKEALLAGPGGGKSGWIP